MEIKINKEIRSYKETVYFGLTVRQLICSLLAVGTAVGLHFALRGVLDRETLAGCASLALRLWRRQASSTTTA